MRRMLGVLSVLLLLPASARAQAEPRDLFQGLNKGTRCEVETKEGAVFRGFVLYIDPSRRRVKLDVSLENHLLEGAMTFDRVNLKRVTPMRSLTEEERHHLLDEREVRQKAVAAELDRIEKERAAAAAAEKKAAEEAQAADTAEEDPEAGGPEAAQLKSGLDLLKKFPPKEGWGEERYQWLQIKSPTIGAVLTPEEEEFVNGYESWKKALAFGEEEAKKAADDAKKKAEGEANQKLETPAPEPTGKPAPEKQVSSSRFQVPRFRTHHAFRPRI